VCFALERHGDCHEHEDEDDESEGRDGDDGDGCDDAPGGGDFDGNDDDGVDVQECHNGMGRDDHPQFHVSRLSFGYNDGYDDENSGDGGDGGGESVGMVGGTSKSGRTSLCRHMGRQQALRKTIPVADDRIVYVAAVSKNRYRTAHRHYSDVDKSHLDPAKRYEQ